MGNAGNLLWIVGGVAGAAIGVFLWLLIGMGIFGYAGWESVLGLVGFALVAGAFGAVLAAPKR